MRVGHPQFEGQTKTKLGNSEVEGLVNTVVGEALAKYLEENPRNAKLIAKKGLLAAEAREAAKKAKDLLRKRKDALGGGGLPASCEIASAARWRNANCTWWKVIRQVDRLKVADSGYAGHPSTSR